MTLTEIKKFAIANGACESQLNKFIGLIINGDEFQAWQTVLGNYIWLHRKGFPMKRNEVEILAQGVAKVWHDNGQLYAETTYKEGKRNGLYRKWYLSGQLLEEYNYKEGKRDGLYRRWYPSGQLLEEYNYKEDKRNGLYRKWYLNDKLWEEFNYKNGELITA